MRSLLNFRSLAVATFMTANTGLKAADLPQAFASPVEGRWDITVDFDGKPAPSWLEINHSGNDWLVGSYVGVVGSARPISKIIFVDNKLTFTIPPQWEEERNDITVEAALKGDSLVGIVKEANGKIHNWVGKRAPYLHPEKTPVWGKPIALFNGTNLKGWHTKGDNQWVVEKGVLKSPKSGSNLITDQKFSDFKLHIEFRCPAGSNSGVYLRGRYELQIMDSKGERPEKGLMGAIYGFITPNQMAAKSAGEWQSYDVTLVGRMVTVVANGKQIIWNQEIPGITGGALDSNEGEPGNIFLQGDHGPIEYRNIIITPAK